MNTVINDEALKIFATYAKVSLSDAECIMKEVQLDNYIKEHHTASIWVKDGVWKTNVPDANAKSGRRQITAKTEERFKQKLYDFYQKSEEETLRTLYPAWCEYRESYVASDETLIVDKREWKRHFEHSSIVDVPLKDLTALELEKWLNHTIKEKNLNRSAYYRMSLIPREMLAFAERINKIEKNPMANVKINFKLLAPTVKKKPDEQVFIGDEVHRMVTLCWEDFHIAGRKVYRLAPLACAFVFFTGLRVGELTGLKLSDVNGNYLRVERFVRRNDHKVMPHTKTESGDRDIYLPDDALKIIEACRQYKEETGSKSDWIFSEYKRPLPSRIVEEYYQKYCLILKTKSKSTHCGRKTYASTLHTAGVNIDAIRRAMGHIDELTTLRCYVYDPTTETQRNAQFDHALSYSIKGQSVS